jgi:OHCU decarboxylase
MRSDPAEYELVAPGTLPAVLSLLGEQPGVWIPIAGGTDIMVLYAAGKLSARKLLSIWNLPELRRIDVAHGEIRVGAGCTYTDLRRHTVLAQEFPLLATAARWTGGIANQNRGTLGGNIVNASPAADSLPALLVYEAELILVSMRGERRVRYTDFHSGYKTTVLAPDELVQAVCLPRIYGHYVPYSRKVGARNAQAISKVCIAGLAKSSNGVLEDVRIAVGSVAPVPLRLSSTERTITGKHLDAEIIQQARRTAIDEVRPIDDIRSTEAYRRVVSGNLVAEFLQKLRNAAASMSEVLTRWNQLSPADAAREILPCCGSEAWARELVGRRPLNDEKSLLAASDNVWESLETKDWMEAFARHPRIGERQAPASASSQAATWSVQEQQKVAAAEEAVQAALAAGNREYERRFGRIFLVCATGKSADEILAVLKRRLQNSDAAELREAVEEQRKITNLRLKKWLA